MLVDVRLLPVTLAGGLLGTKVKIACFKNYFTQRTDIILNATKMVAYKSITLHFNFNN